MRLSRLLTHTTVLCVLLLPSLVHGQAEGILSVRCSLNGEPSDTGDILVDGKKIGQCPRADAFLKAGSHKINISYKPQGNSDIEKYEFSESIDVILGSPLRVIAELKPIYKKVDYGTEGAVVFKDEFSSIRISDIWTVERANGGAGYGKPANLSIFDGKLLFDIDGSSSGYMGVADGTILKTSKIGLSGDFQIILSGREISRTKNSEKDNSGVYLGLSDRKRYIAISIRGDNLGYFNNRPYGTYTGHRIQNECGAGFEMDKELEIGKNYSFDLMIASKGGKLYTGYRLNGQTNWEMRECDVEMDSPELSIGVNSGDGGNTSKNGGFKVLLTRLLVLK